MKLTDFIKTLIELNEHDPTVEIFVVTDNGSFPVRIGNVVLFDGVATIYGEEQQ